MRKLPFAIASTLLLTSCAGIAPGALPGAGKLVTVKGDVKVVESKAFKLKAANDQPRVPYELRRLDHIEVWIENTDLGGGAALAGTLPYVGSGDADHTFAPIELRNLKSYSHYKVTLKAFQFDPAQGGVVQVDENGVGESETTFDTVLNSGAFSDAANELVELPSGFNLKLRDQSFNGRAVGELDTNLSVVNGVLVDPVTAEEVHVPTNVVATFNLYLNCDYGACTSIWSWYPAYINGGATFHFTAQDPGTTSWDTYLDASTTTLGNNQALTIDSLPASWTVTATGGVVSDPGYNYPGNIGTLTATSDGAGGVTWSFANHPDMNGPFGTQLSAY